MREDVNVERVSLNKYIDTAPPPVRYEGDTMIIPVLREVTVIEKRLLLVEELRVTKHRTELEETQDVSLRKEEIKVTRAENDTDTAH